LQEDDHHGHSHAGGSAHGHAHGSGDEYKNMTDDDHGHSHAGGGNHGHAHGHGDDEEPHHPEEENLNVKAALIHVIGDALQSVGVMIAAAFIWYEPEWRIADPVSFLLHTHCLISDNSLLNEPSPLFFIHVYFALDSSFSSLCVFSCAPFCSASWCCSRRLA